MSVVWRFLSLVVRWLLLTAPGQWMEDLFQKVLTLAMAAAKCDSDKFRQQVLQRSMLVRIILHVIQKQHVSSPSITGQSANGVEMETTRKLLIRVVCSILVVKPRLTLSGITSSGQRVAMAKRHSVKKTVLAPSFHPCQEKALVKYGCCRE